MKQKHKCSICKEEFTGFGNNPEPIHNYDDRCCDLCNDLVVIPVRIFGMRHPEALKAIQGRQK